MILTSLPHPGIVLLAMNDPEKRNALSIAMFSALEDALTRIVSDDSIVAIVLAGEGAAFCAGFDLGACVETPSLLPTFIERLSLLNRSIRRLPQVVIASVHGAAIAGGCALLSACDFVVVAPDATLGYPVHPIGISPAVTIPTLRCALGDGATRALLVSGELISGSEAYRRGLATHLAEASEPREHAMAMALNLARKGHHALRVTKSWLNELEGSLDDAAFDATATGSAAASTSAESQALLRRFWQARRT